MDKHRIPNDVDNTEDATLDLVYLYIKTLLHGT